MRYKRTSVVALLVLASVAILGLLLFSVSGPRYVQAASPPLVHLDPPSITVETGSEVTVLVNIDSAENLGGFQFDLLFPAGILEATGAELDPYLSSTGRTPIPLGPIIDNTQGKLTFGAATGGDAPGAGGNGTLARVTFRALTSGTGAMSLSEIQLLDTTGQPLKAAFKGARVRVTGSPVPAKPPARPTTPPTQTAPPTVSGSSFDTLRVFGIGGLIFVAIAIAIVIGRRRRQQQ